VSIIAAIGAIKTAYADMNFRKVEALARITYIQGTIALACLRPKHDRTALSTPPACTQTI